MSDSSTHEPKTQDSAGRSKETAISDSSIPESSVPGAAGQSRETMASGSNPAFWKSLAFFLLFLLIGIYVLYEWYDDQLYGQLAEKDAQIERANQKMRDAESLRAQAEQTRLSVRSDMKTLKEQLEQEKQQLQSQIDDGVRAKADLEKAITDLKSTHVSELAARQQHINDLAIERDQLAARLADLESRYEDAKKEIASLKADLNKVQEAIADSAAEHRARILELERHLNERIHLSRTTPMDETLVKAAQEVGVLPGMKASDEHAKAAEEELQSANAELDALKEDYAAVQAQLEQAQEQLGELKTQMAEGEAAVAALEQSAAEGEHARAAASEEEIQSLKDRLAREDEVREALQQQHDAAIMALRESLSETNAQLASVTSELETTHALLQAAEQARGDEPQDSQAHVQALQAQLEQEQARAEETNAALREEIDGLQAKLAALSEQSPQADADTAALDRVPDSQLADAQAKIADLQYKLDAARKAMAAAKDAETALAERRALEAAFASLNGTYTDKGLLLRLAESELKFAPGQSALPAGELESLDRIAGLLSQQPGLSVRIQGYTDSVGPDALNLRLSEERAKAVRQALIERGIDSARLEAEGLGSAAPIASNATVEGRGKNRRVEVYLID